MGHQFYLPYSKTFWAFEDLMRKLRFNSTVNLRERCIFRKTTNSVFQSLSLPFSHSGSHHSFSSVQQLSRVQLFVTPWIAARQASLSITNSRSSLRLMSIESVMPSSHLILCCPLLFLPPIPSSIRVFSITTVQKHQFFGTQLSSQSNTYIHTWPQEKP